MADAAARQLQYEYKAVSSENRSKSQIVFNHNLNWVHCLYT